MKVVFQKNSLESALRAISPVEKLSGRIAISATEDGCWLTARSEFHYISHKVDAQVEVAGSFEIESKHISNAIRFSPSLTLEISKGKILIKTGNIRANINQAIQSYTRQDPPIPDSYYFISASDFLEGMVAASIPETDRKRGSMLCCIDFSDSQLEFWSTDSNCASHYFAECKPSGPVEEVLTLPIDISATRLCEEVIRRSSSEEIMIGGNQNQMTIWAEDFIFRVSLSSRSFPNSFKKKMVQVKSLPATIAAIDSSVVNDRIREVMPYVKDSLYVSVKGQGLSLFSSGEFGDIEVVAKCSVSGSDIRVLLSASYIEKVFHAIRNNEEAFIKFTGELSPVIVVAGKIECVIQVCSGKG